MKKYLAIFFAYYSVYHMVLFLWTWTVNMSEAYYKIENVCLCEDSLSLYISQLGKILRFIINSAFSLHLLNLFCHNGE